MTETKAISAREFVNQMLPVGLEMVKNKTRGLNCVIGLNLLGEGGGRWTITIRNDQTRLEEGVTDYLDCVLSVQAEDYLSLVSGKLNPYDAMAKGKIGISGDLGTAFRLRSLFKI